MRFMLFSIGVHFVSFQVFNRRLVAVM